MKTMAFIIVLFLCILFIVDLLKLEDRKHFWLRFFDVMIDGGLLVVAAALFREVF